MMKFLLLLYDTRTLDCPSTTLSLPLIDFHSLVLGFRVEKARIVRPIKDVGKELSGPK
jgi:hypothetical protein